MPEADRKETYDARREANDILRRQEEVERELREDLK